MMTAIRSVNLSQGNALAREAGSVIHVGECTYNLMHINMYARVYV